MNCEDCKHYKTWFEYGELFGDCYYNDVDHLKWYMKATDNLDEEDKTIVAEDCPNYEECHTRYGPYSEQE